MNASDTTLTGVLEWGACQVRSIHKLEAWEQYKQVSPQKCWWVKRTALQFTIHFKFRKMQMVLGRQEKLLYWVHRRIHGETVNSQLQLAYWRQLCKSHDPQTSLGCIKYCWTSNNFLLLTGIEHFPYCEIFFRSNTEPDVKLKDEKYYYIGSF